MTTPTPKNEELKIRLNGNIAILEELLDQIGNKVIRVVDNGKGQENTIIDLVAIIDDLAEIEEEL